MGFFLFPNLTERRWKRPLELFKLLGTVAIDNAKAIKSIEDTTDKAEQSESRMGKAFSKIGSAAVAVGKKMAQGLAVGTAAMGALLVKSLSLAGDLEQNLGGSEAVFGEYATKMQEIADEAFSNMGLSASDFLATANKMGSLFKGAGFDVKTASDLTAKAMQRAADVASIMGIDVSVAMESIAGAAKGNFSMLDNLGVAMNDTQLQAYALAQGIETSTQEMTQQEKIGLAMQMFLEKTADYAGNYARENKTLAGSLTTLKAAFKNFFSGAGDAETLASSLVSSGEVIAEKIEALLPSLISGISTLLEKLVPKIPALVSRVLPTIINGVIGLVKSLLGERVSTLVSDLFKSVRKTLDMIFNNKELWASVKKFLDSIIGLLEELLPIITDIAEEFTGGFVVALTAVLNVLSEVIDVITVVVRVFGKVYDAITKGVGVTYELTDAQREAAASAKLAADEYADMCLEYEKNAATIDQEAKRAEKLWEELQTLADESGNVKEADQERAKYILGELKEATGKEWELIDGTIQRYKDMQAEVSTLIELRKAERRLTAFEDRYNEAQDGMDEYFKTLHTNEGTLADLQQELADNKAEYEDWLTRSSGFTEEQQQAARKYYSGKISEEEARSYISDYEIGNVIAFRNAIEDSTQKIKEQEEVIKTNKATIATAHADIDTYLKAEAALAEGNYERVVEILSQETAARWAALAELDLISAEKRKELEDEIDLARNTYETVAEMFRQGAKGVTIETVEEAQKALELLRAIYDDAYGEAVDGGLNIMRGLQRGLEMNAPVLYESTRSIANRTLRTFTEVAQIASPSKVTTQYGRYLIDGLVRGMNDNAGEAEKEAASVMNGTLGALATSGVENRMALSSVASEIANNTAANGDNKNMRVMFEEFVSNLPDMLMDAFTSMKFDVNNREFARMVKAVNH